MKKQDKIRKAGYLLEEIGNISDRFLTEAIPADRPQIPRKNYALRYLLAAACFALVMTIGFGTAISAFLRHMGTTTPSNPDQTEQGTPSLDAILLACTESDSFHRIREEDVNFFDDNVRVIVKDLSTGEVFVSHALTVWQRSVLHRELEASAHTVTGEEPAPAYLVWITYGYGRVVTPCLTPSSGNVGAAVLFDYDPERIPTDLFIQLLSGMIRPPEINA